MNTQDNQIQGRTAEKYCSIRSQANVMMLGECLCMLVYVIYWWAGELNLVCLRPTFLYASASMN